MIDYEAKREQVIEYIKTCSHEDRLHIVDALVEPVASYLGCADGLENTKHNLLMQILSDEHHG
jgi:hypothetical protein